MKIEEKILDYVLTGEKINKMTGDDHYHQKYYQLQKESKEFNKLLNKWKSLINDINNYYKNKLTKAFKKGGADAARKLHREIMKSLKRNNQYECGTMVVCFDITEFGSKLIKQTT